ncbi:hypothetical protein Neosp_006547 [[Neocosmospora] mangrovei]
MEGQTLKRNVVEPATIHNSTFILLHDRGSSGAEFQRALCSALLPTLISQVAPGTRFIFPDGPFSDRNGRRDWYRLEDPQLECGETASLDQWRHVMYAAEEVDMVVEDEARLIGRENVFLGGVGKGCAVAMMTLLEMDRPIGGFIGFGGWMPFVRDMRDVATLGKILTPDPPFSQNNQGGIGDMAPGQVNGLVDPRMLSIQDNQQQQPFPQAVSSTPVSELPDQSVEARHQRVADFLRQFEWSEKARDEYKNEFSTATPIVLTHSSNDELVSRSHAKEAQMMLFQLGYHVKLGESNSGHTITKEVLDWLISTLLEVVPFSYETLRSGLMRYTMGY